jgi:hypothetical protein
VHRLAAVAVLAMTTVAATTLPAGASGSKVHDVKDGFSFSLPSGWLQIPLTGRDVSGLLDAATKADPALKGALTTQVQQYVKKGVKIFVVGPIVRGEASNINAIVASSAGLPSGATYFDELGVQVKIGLSSIGGQHVVTSKVKFAKGTQLQATYSLPTSMIKNGAYGVQLYIRHLSHLIVITFTSATKADSKRIAREVEKTWTWS